MRDFLIFCSGADKNVLEHCPTPEMAKYEGIGGTVFFTGLFAMLSGGYALYFVFHAGEYALLSAIGLGIIWGLFIFNLDRYIVSSMVKQGSFLSDLKLAIPRLMLAILLAIVISTPLELKLFETEINSQLLSIEEKKEQELLEGIRKGNESLRDAIESLKQDVEVRRKELDTLRLELNKRKDIRDKFDQIAQEEADGTGGTGTQGLKKIYELKKANADKAQKEVDELNQFIIQRKNRFMEKEGLLKSKEEELDSSEKNKAKNLKQEKEKIGKYDGLAARLEALGELTTANDFLWFAYLFITLLFFTIETAPIFVKIISNKGPYDFILEEKSRKTIAGYTDSKSVPVPRDKKEKNGKIVDPWGRTQSIERLNRKKTSRS